MRLKELLLKVATAFCVCALLYPPMIVRADLIWEPIEEELVINEEKEEGGADAALAGAGVTALVAVTGALIAVLFKKNKNDKGED